MTPPFRLNPVTLSLPLITVDSVGMRNRRNKFVGPDKKLFFTNMVRTGQWYRSRIDTSIRSPPYPMPGLLVPPHRAPFQERLNFRRWGNQGPYLHLTQSPAQQQL